MCFTSEKNNKRIKNSLIISCRMVQVPVCGLSADLSCDKPLVNTREWTLVICLFIVMNIKKLLPVNQQQKGLTLFGPDFFIVEPPPHLESQELFKVAQ